MLGFLNFRQIALADLLILNKIDQASDQEKNQVKDIVRYRIQILTFFSPPLTGIYRCRKINSSAPLVETVRCR